MDIKKISEKKNTLKLLFKGMDNAFVNAIRRTIMTEVPVLAIEDISIYENSSILFDEFLAHRLGMVPLTTDLKTYKKKEKVKLILEKEGPGTVYSKDLKCTDPKIEVADKKIALVKLGKDQKVKAEMEAVMGSGSKHAKWQPAVVGYRNLPIITVGKKCTVCRDCIKACPTEVLEEKAKKIVLKDPLGCVLCGKCRDVCKEECLELGYDESSFVFGIESHGNLKNQEILLSASAELGERCKEFRSGLKKL